MDRRREELLGGLTEAQRQAVAVEAAPLCVLAGAGSGKTRVLTRRIAWRIHEGSAEAAHVLALTFTRKASGELRRRLHGLGIRDQVAAGTFHALAWAQLRQRWADRGRTPPALLERKAGILASLLSARDMSQEGGTWRPARLDAESVVPARGGRGARGDAGGLWAEVAGEIEWAKARLVGPERYAQAAADAGRRAPLPAGEMAGVYAAYEAEKQRRGMVDFDDLLLACGEAIERDPAFAAAQRWRFRHLFVDEFQDINPAQDRLLRAWLGDRLDLCVVGDPRQAIYAWNGADPTVLTDLPERYPSATVVRLDDNWRSSPQILAVAHAVLAHGRGGPPGRAGAGERAASGGASAQGLGPASGGACAQAVRLAAPSTLRPRRPDGPMPTVTCYESDRAEARGIAVRLRQGHRPGRAWSHLAVLTRTNAQLVLLEEALRSTGIPCRVAGGGGFLRSPEVNAALHAMGGGARSFPAAVVDLEETARATRAAGATSEAADLLDALSRLAREYQAQDPRASVQGFWPWLSATVGKEGGDEGGDAVELATFHRSKGLEWPVVFVAGLERGLVPIGHATTPAADAEERRLLYVALTRAEAELHCSWAQSRAYGGRNVGRQPSPYLESIDLAVTSFGGGERPHDVAARLEPGRRHLRALAQAGPSPRPVQPGRAQRPLPAPERPALVLARSADPQVLEALRAWRSTTARASGVPAYVIFHDSTLATLASARPTNTDELLSLPGLGPVKTARYGQVLLDVMARASA